MVGAGQERQGGWGLGFGGGELGESGHACGGAGGSEGSNLPALIEVVGQGFLGDLVVFPDDTVQRRVLGTPTPVGPGLGAGGLGRSGSRPADLPLTGMGLCGHRRPGMSRSFRPRGLRTSGAGWTGFYPRTTIGGMGSSPAQTEPLSGSPELTGLGRPHLDVHKSGDQVRHRM